MSKYDVIIIEDLEIFSYHIHTYQEGGDDDE